VLWLGFSIAGSRIASLLALVISLGSSIKRAVRGATVVARRRLRPVRGAVAFAVLLGGVSSLLFAPLLIDDFSFHRSYLLRPSEDALHLSKPTVLSEQPRLTLDRGVLSVPPSLSGKARTVEALTALIKGGSARLSLNRPVFTLELATNSSGEIEPATMMGPVVRSPLLAALDETAFETLLIRDGTINVRTPSGRVEVLQAVSADVTVKRKSAVRLKGSFTLHGEALAFDITLGSRIDRRDGTRMPVKAQVRSALFEATVDGRLDLSSPVKLVSPATEIKIGNLRSLARWLGHEWPSGLGLKDALIRGHVDWSGDRLTLQKGEFSLDDNTGTGTLALTLAAGRPRLIGTLAFDALDLTPYLPTPLADDHALFTRFKSLKDLSLPLVGFLDTDMRISTNTLSVGSLQAGRAAAGLNVKQGRVELELAEMVLDGPGRLSGAISIAASPTAPTYQTRLKLESFDLGALSGFIAGAPLLTGRGGVTFEAKSNGLNGMEILSRATGRLAVDLPQGGSVTCSMKSLSVVALAKGTNPTGGCRTWTSVSAFHGAAHMIDGVLATDTITATSGAEELRLDGLLDLVSSLMDLTASSKFPGDDVEAKPQTVVSIRGRMDAPVIGMKSPTTGP
jgi:hypothetical protein